jgi:hypothetical protein
MRVLPRRLVDGQGPARQRMAFFADSEARADVFETSNQRLPNRVPTVT